MRPGQRAIIAIDAFPPTQWGWFDGTLQELSDDYVLVRDQPMVRGWIGLVRNLLEHSDGKEVLIERG